jgi:SNF2 family DNA or RNA helicase
MNELSKYKTKPYQHQLDCLQKHGQKRAFALLAEMGTGKTWIIINNAADLWASGELDACLIFAPNGVHSNWTERELPKHMPDWVNYKAASWVSGAKKADKEALEALYDLPEDGSRRLRILTMNWEALQSKRGFEEAKRFANSSGKLMIVADESSCIKNPAAARTKALMELRKFSHYRRTMDGTPINNSPFDTFAPFTFLDPTILGTTSFYSFKAEYAEMLHDGDPRLEAIKKKITNGGTRRSPTPQIVATGSDGRPKYRNLPKLTRLIEPHSFRVLKKDCLDLPEKIYKTVLFDLTKEQKAIYDKAKDECRLVLEGEETPFNKLVAVTKLAQITSGYYVHPLSNVPVRIEGDNPKLDCLSDRVHHIVGDLGEKVIIWARYRIEIEDIVKRLKKDGFNDIVEYHGGTSDVERSENIDAFMNGSANIFVGNQQAGGTGITLTSASYMIYFSNNFSLRDRLQSEDRAHRIGQDKNVTYINLAAKGTIDEGVIRALESKKDIADIIIDKGFALLNGVPF